MSKKYSKMRLILGDQLNCDHSWFAEKNQEEILYVMMEIKPESEYVTHHIQKIVGIFAAMREFAKGLQTIGLDVKYYKIDDAKNLQSFQENLNHLINLYNIRYFEYQEPDEYRLDLLFASFSQSISIPCKVYSTEHFYTERTELANFFKRKKQLLLETFYRNMRRKHNIFLDEKMQPIGGKWNFDSENRKKLPDNVVIPPHLFFDRDCSEIVNQIHKMELKFIGNIKNNIFSFPINKIEAEQLLDYFLENQLLNFGKYQDALTQRDNFVFHSRLSFAMNIKLISPKYIVDRVAERYSKYNQEQYIAAYEGFIRQILGWREYIRGIYWKEMPNYAQLNYFNAENKLPSLYWTAGTKMKCLHHSIKQSLDLAYAHHIQRLMVTGNFATLIGVHPDQVDSWYLGIYIDAFEWVEMPNTRGMSQYADGGIVGSKPYVSSAAYMHKMGDYCVSCYYDKDKKVGERACPFNSLYWHFIARNEDKLKKNMRMSMMLSVWNKKPHDEKMQLLNQAEKYLSEIDKL